MLARLHPMRRQTVLHFLVLAAATLFALSSVVTPFAGYNPDAFPIPQQTPVAQPAGYAFSIWGLIYLWLIASALFGLMARRMDTAWERPNRYLLVSLVFGVPWLWIASQSPVAATVVVWIMQATAVLALIHTPLTDRWWLRGPVALYAGWLTAAGSVSVAVVGAGYGLLVSAEVWAICAILFAGGITLAMLRNVEQIPEFGAAGVWALAAIAAKQAYGTPSIAVIAGVAATAVALLLVSSRHTSPSTR